MLEVVHRVIRKVTGQFGELEIACSERECPYNLPAYDQDAERHAKGEPHYHGLCLNCLDDYNQDMEFIREEYGR